MEEWIDKEIHAVIECGFDEITGMSRPIIAIGDKNSPGNNLEMRL